MISFSPIRFACCCFAVSLAVFPGAAQQNPATGSNLRASAASAPLNSPRTPLLTTEMRGDIYMARKMYREAIDMYREGPSDSAILANKTGIAFHQLMQLDLAKKNYERAIKLDPKYPEAINNLGTVYYTRNSYRRAVHYYKRALKYSGPSASIEANLGAAYFSKKDYKRATQWYDRALKLDPDIFEHHSTFGTMLQERTIAERATFHFYLARTYAKSGAKERALIYLRKALEEGIKDRKKIPDLPEFASLKKDPAFKELLAENPKPL